MKILCFDIKYIGWAPKIIKEAKLRRLVLNEWVLTRNKIRAIKKHRELTGSSLKDAKWYCDDLQLIANQKIQATEKDTRA